MLKAFLRFLFSFQGFDESRRDEGSQQTTDESFNKPMRDHDTHNDPH